MARQARPLALDDDPLVPLTLKVPSSLLRLLHSYCVFRGHDERKTAAAAVAAIGAYFTGDGEFQAWRREHPDVLATASAPMPKPSRHRRGTRADTGLAGD